MAVELLSGTGPTGVRSSSAPAGLSPVAEAADGFADALGQLIDGVAQTTEGDTNVAVSNMLNKSGDVHDAMIALQQAEMTLQLTVQLRNKLLQSYQEIMRMSV